MLNKIWENQKNFNKNFVDYDNLTDELRQEHTKEYVLMLIDETIELLNEINYKQHRMPKDTLTISNIREEWIDTFKYWLSIGLIWGWTPKTFVDAYFDKSLVVEQRHKQELELDLKKDERIIGVDIDGVLADYPVSFQNFIKSETGIWVDVNSYDLYEAYEQVISRTDMIQLKHKYRESGQKRYIPICEGAVQFLNNMKKQEYTIVLLTSRPYEQYERIFGDTIHWLHKNKLQYDAILWDEEKNYKAISQFPNMKFMVEDNLKFANNVAKLGYKVYLIDKLYNQGDKHPNVIPVKKLEEIIHNEKQTI